jgi:hypothetical protein
MSSVVTSPGSLTGVVEHVDRDRAVSERRECEHRERPLAVERDHAGAPLTSAGRT